MTDYRAFAVPDGVPLPEMEFDPAEARRDPFTELACAAIMKSPDAGVRIYRALPAEADAFNPGGDFVTFDPRIAFSHAQNVASRQRRQMHVIAANVPARVLRGVSENLSTVWFHGSDPVVGEEVDTHPEIGERAAAREVEIGDWFSTRQGDDPDGGEFWMLCVGQTDTGLQWRAPAGVFEMPYAADRVTHRIPVDDRPLRHLDA